MPFFRREVCVCVLFLGCLSSVSAQAGDARSLWMDVNRADQCFARTAAESGIPHNLLLALKVKESGLKFNPDVMSQNRNGTFDHGLFQINSVWVPTLEGYGIKKDMLFDPCVNVRAAAWILSKSIRSEGNWKLGIGKYHTGSITSSTHERAMRYADHVLRIYAALNQKAAVSASRK